MVPWARLKQCMDFRRHSGKLRPKPWGGGCPAVPCCGCSRWMPPAI